MNKAMKARLGVLGIAAMLMLICVIVATGVTGAYFSDSHEGEIKGSTGSIKVKTSGGSGPEDLNFNFKYLLPGEPQTATVEFNNTGHNNQDVWIKFDPDALHALNNLGRYGEVTLENASGTLFHSANLNDNLPPASGTCGPFSPSGCWPLEEQYKVRSNLSPGSGSYFKFTFGYTTYKGGIGNAQQNQPWNTYPPEVAPEDIEGNGLPYEVIATQVGVEP